MSIERKQTKELNTPGHKAWAVGSPANGWTVFLGTPNQDLSIGYAESLAEACELVYDYWSEEKTD